MPERATTPDRPAARTRRRRWPTVAAPAVALAGAGLLLSAAASFATATGNGPGGGGDHGGGDAAATVEPFGAAPDGTPVERWTLTNGGVTMRVLW